MKAPKCYQCDGRHWSKQPCPAINGAINKPKKRLTDAINTVVPEKPQGMAAGPDLPRVSGRRSAQLGVEGRTSNRRGREDYNTYMKGYMRAYRERHGT